MKVRNKDVYMKWKRVNANDGYSFDIFKFSEKWADLMEEEVEKGHNIEEIADDTSKIAGIDELTNTMFDSALDILYRCWIYGYELETWFKRKKSK